MAQAIWHERKCPLGQVRQQGNERHSQGRPWQLHDVVVLNHHLTAVIGHCEEGGTRAHEGLGQSRHADKCLTGQVHGGKKSLSWNIDHASLQRLPSMDQKSRLPHCSEILLGLPFQLGLHGRLTILGKPQLKDHQQLPLFS